MTWRDKLQQQTEKKGRELAGKGVKWRVRKQTRTRRDEEEKRKKERRRRYTDMTVIKCHCRELSQSNMKARFVSRY